MQHLPQSALELQMKQSSAEWFGGFSIWNQINYIARTQNRCDAARE